MSALTACGCRIPPTSHWLTDTDTQADRETLQAVVTNYRAAMTLVNLSRQPNECRSTEIGSSATAAHPVLLSTQSVGPH